MVLVADHCWKEVKKILIILKMIHKIVQRFRSEVDLLVLMA